MGNLINIFNQKNTPEQQEIVDLSLDIYKQITKNNFDGKIVFSKQHKKKLMKYDFRKKEITIYFKSENIFDSLFPVVYSLGQTILNPSFSSQILNDDRYLRLPEKKPQKKELEQLASTLDEATALAFCDKFLESLYSCKKPELFSTTLNNFNKYVTKLREEYLLSREFNKSFVGEIESNLLCASPEATGVQLYCNLKLNQLKESKKSPIKVLKEYSRKYLDSLYPEIEKLL